VNKSELVDAVAASADLPKAAAGRAIDAMIDAITDSLTKEEPVVLVGFGTFATVVIPKPLSRFKLKRLRCLVLRQVKRLRIQLIRWPKSF